MGEAQSLQSLDFADARGAGRIVFNPSLARHPKPEWFDASHWGEAAKPVTSGGRGAAWFVEGPFGRAVLRQYLRGGQMARISRDAYWWSGEAGVRSHNELELLALMRSLQLPVPEPVASIHWRKGMVYRAAILVGTIPHTRTFASVLEHGPRAERLWSRIGILIARFHQARIHHADLNAHNVLVDAEGLCHLIDFDKSERRLKGDNDWQAENMARFARSVQKVCGEDVALAAAVNDAVQGAYREASR